MAQQTTQNETNVDEVMNSVKYVAKSYKNDPVLKDPTNMKKLVEFETMLDIIQKFSSFGLSRG